MALAGWSPVDYWGFSQMRSVAGRVAVCLACWGVGVGALLPAVPLVEVAIPRRLSDGVALPGLGVSLTPVDASGSSLAGLRGLDRSLRPPRLTERSSGVRPVLRARMGRAI